MSLDEILEAEDLGRIDVVKVLDGGYNRGFVVENDYDVGGEIIESSDEAILWKPLEDSTPEMMTQSDLLCYHLARHRNAESMRGEGLQVPESQIIGGETDTGYRTFLATPFVDHQSYEQRPKFPGGDMRRNNPHTPDPYESPERRRFEAKIDAAMDEIDGERLVQEGLVVNAGSGDIDDHNKNWGLVDGELVRLDIGEVPAGGPVWEDMPYEGPEEFYTETGIREEAEELLYNSGIDPEENLGDAYFDI